MIIEPILMGKWSEALRDLVACWENLRLMSLKREDRGQYTICRFAKDLL